MLKLEDFKVVKLNNQSTLVGGEVKYSKSETGATTDRYNCDEGWYEDASGTTVLICG